MKFLVNAHLPRHLVNLLREKGHEAIHTRDLPRGNRTGDAEILAVSLREQRILITKDGDFVDSYLLQKGPFKLLLITTGNISNQELIALFERNLEQIETAFENYSYLELSRTALIFHE